MATDFSSLGRTLTGAAAATSQTELRLPEAPRKDFILAHHPQGWDLEETGSGGHEWLPRLKPLVLMPGVNGVRGLHGSRDDSLARVQMQNKGWTMIDRSLGYITKYPCLKGDSTYLTWDVPKVIGNRVIVSHDRVGYNAFRRSLVEDGILAAPDPQVLAGILEGIDRRIERNYKSAHIPSVKAKIEADQKLKASAPKSMQTKKKQRTKRANADV